MREISIETRPRVGKVEGTPKERGDRSRKGMDN